MEVELLFWAGCPSHPAALAELRAALGGGVPVVVREIATEEQAVAERFPGSPTIRVDGVDLFPVDDPPSLSCRVYRLADGRFSPTPDPGLLREALAGPEPRPCPGPGRSFRPGPTPGEGDLRPAARAAVGPPGHAGCSEASRSVAVRSG